MENVNKTITSKDLESIIKNPPTKEVQNYTAPVMSYQTCKEELGTIFPQTLNINEEQGAYFMRLTLP